MLPVLWLKVGTPLMISTVGQNKQTKGPQHLRGTRESGMSAHHPHTLLLCPLPICPCERGPWGPCILLPFNQDVYPAFHQQTPKTTQQEERPSQTHRVEELMRVVSDMSRVSARPSFPPQAMPGSCPLTTGAFTPRPESWSWASGKGFRGQKRKPAGRCRKSVCL